MSDKSIELLSKYVFDNRIFLAIFFVFLGVCVSPMQIFGQAFQCSNALYFTSSANTNVYRYTPSTNSLTQVSGISINYGSSSNGSAAAGITPGGDRLYFNDRISPRRLRYNTGNTTNTNAGTQTDDSGNAQRSAIDISGNGYYMLGLATAPATYYRFTTGGATSTTTGPFTLNVQPSSAPAISNGGDLAFDANDVAYLVDQSRNLYLVNFSTNVATYLGGISGMGSASPNGVGFSGTNLYISTLDNTLYQVNLATMAATLLTPSSTPSGFSQNDIATCIYPPNLVPSIAATKAWRNVTKGDPTNFSTSTSASVGDTIEYRVIVRNSGAVSSGNTTFQDSIPSGMTYTSGSTTLNGSAVTDSAGTGNSRFFYRTAQNINGPSQGVGVLRVDSTPATTTDNEATIIFRVTVNSPFDGAANPIPNTAQVNYNGASAAVSSNTVNTSVVFSDLQLAKSHTGNFTLGSSGTYTFTVTNSGTASSSGTITVSDTLPAGLTVNGGSSGGLTEGGTNAANWTCNSNSSSPQTVTCTSSTAISSTSGSNTSVFNFAVNIGTSTAVGTNSITNTASVSGGGETNTTNNSASDPTTVLAPDLTIGKSHTGNFTLGSSGTYTFTVTNSGTASSNGTITVSDTLPTGLTVNGGSSGGLTEGGTNAANWTCNSNSSNPQTITCTSSTAIAASGTSVFSFAVNVGTSTAVGTDSITNTTSVSGGGEVNTTNNSASDPTTILAPDLTINKSHSSDFTVGSLGNYSFTVTNSGTATSSGTITVSDTLPSGLVVNGGSSGTVTLGGTNAANWSCSSNSSAPQTVTCTSSTAISASSSSTYNFDVYVGSSTSTGTNSITNTASVSGGGEVNTGNNSDNDPTTVLTEPTAPAPGTTCSAGTAVNLLSTVPFSRFYDTNVTSGISDTIPLITNASNYRLGTGPSNRIIVDLTWGWNNGEPRASSTQSTYTLTINGTNYARITTDPVASGLVATVAGLNGASVSDSTIAVGSYPPSNYQQSYVTLPASVTQVTSGSITFASPGAAPGDDIAINISTIYACSPAVSVTKSSNGAWAIGQSGAEYTLAVTNSGAATTFGTTTVRDALPSGVTPNWTGTRNVTSGGLTWACTFSGQNVTCTTSNGLSNSSGSNTSQITLPVNVTSSAAIGTNSITNYGSIGGGGDPYNSGSAPTPGSTCTDATHCATNQTTVNSPDLTIAKSHTGNFTPGSNGVYSLTIGNSGTVTTSGTVTITDSLPTGLSIANGVVTLSGTNAANWSCSSTSNVITCNSSVAIPISGSSSFSFTVNIASNATGSVTNTANVSGGNEATANNGNNSASDPTTISSSPPNVTLAKTCPLPANCTTAPQLPGTDVTYQINFANTGGLSAANLSLVDGIPANMDYKLGSATATVGTTGLIFTIEFSSDYDALSPTLATWTYTPVSGGGGASTGYDRAVKAIRWRVTSGVLSSTSPNNAGYVNFVTKIR